MICYKMRLEEQYEHNAKYHLFSCISHRVGKSRICTNIHPQPPPSPYKYPLNTTDLRNRPDFVSSNFRPFRSVSHKLLNKPTPRRNASTTRHSVRLLPKFRDSIHPNIAVYSRTSPVLSTAIRTQHPTLVCRDWTKSSRIHKPPCSTSR